MAVYAAQQFKGSNAIELWKNVLKMKLWNKTPSFEYLK